MNTLLKLTPVALIAAISACASVDMRDADQSAREEAVGALPVIATDWAAIDAQVGTVENGWINAYDDPMLAALVTEAQTANPDIIAASANVDRSLALARQAGAALSPQVNVTAGTTSAGRTEGAGSTDATLGLQASWEVDVWGRIRSGRDAAVASAEAAEADVRFARQSLAANVAQAYFLVLEAKEQEALSQSNVDSLREIARITNVRAENGLATAQDVSLSRSDLASAEERLTAVSGGRRDASRALEVLIGRYPSAEIETLAALPDVPAPPPAGLPSDILERRPDIVAAERRIAGTISGVNAAKAAKLPSVRLTAGVSGASDDLSSLLDPANIAWQAASSLLVPLIDGGTLDAQVDVATADEKAAVSAYVGAALAAFQDVEVALDATSRLEQQSGSLQIAADEADEALRLAQLRYDEGETDLLDVLSVQQRVNATRSSLIALQRQRLVNYALLNLSLGGAWGE